jgi:RimJ/RimL family protein N-acetyltransferase
VNKNLKIRFSEPTDRQYMIDWLSDPDVLRWFPMENTREIEDAVNICLNYVKEKAILTAEYNNEICGIACLYLSFFKKFAHQCLFVIILDKRYRGRGIGTRLLQELMNLAKERFKIEILHLEVYEGNPAIHLYEKLGFQRYGYQKKFIKLKDKTYLGKIMMQKNL